MDINVPGVLQTYAHKMTTIGLKCPAPPSQCCPWDDLHPQPFSSSLPRKRRTMTRGRKES